MIESLPQIVGLALGLLIAIPMGIHMFRECFSNYKRFKDELKQSQGSEEEKLYDGEFTKAVNHQFIEFKAVFALVFPILVFLLTYFITSSIAESAIQLYAGE